MSNAARKLRATRYLQLRKGHRLHITGPCTVLVKDIKANDRHGEAAVEVDMPEQTKVAHNKPRRNKSEHDQRY